MKVSAALYVTNRKQWRKWLKRHYTTKTEIWLIFHKKHTKKPVISYSDAVEEALCFGWIDSTIKTIDDEKYVRRFTPRSSQSRWSRSNILRAQKMIDEKKMTKTGLALFQEVRRKKIRPRKALVKSEIPLDLEYALRKNRIAWKNFNKFAAGYQKTYIRWILDAKKLETRARRIKRVVRFAAQNIRSVML
jgi:uncharacterized protein YdeI (YjbR/CyaY-like superfamily)